MRLHMTIGALVRVGLGVWGFFWGLMHYNEPTGLFVTLMCCVLLFDEYRRL